MDPKTKLEAIFEEKGLPKEQRDSVLRHITHSNGRPRVVSPTQAVREARAEGWNEEQIEILSELEATLKAQGMPESQRDLTLRRIIWQAEPLRRLHSVSSVLQKQWKCHDAKRDKTRRRHELIRQAQSLGIQNA